MDKEEPEEKKILTKDEEQKDKDNFFSFFEKIIEYEVSPKDKSDKSEN